MLTSLFSLFYVTGEFHMFLHRGRANFASGATHVSGVVALVNTWQPCIPYVFCQVVFLTASGLLLSSRSLA